MQLMFTCKQLNGFSLAHALAVIAACMLIVSKAHADYASAAKAYEAHDFVAAATELQSLAELGHPQSQYSLGAMYLRGEGVNQNLLLAYGWTKLAAEAGHAGAIDLETRMRSSLDAASRQKATDALAEYSMESVGHRLLPKIVEKKASTSYDSSNSPPRFLLFIRPKYPIRLVNQGQSGRIAFDFYVAKDGSVRDVHIIDALPSGLFEASVREAVYKWRFKPGTRDGQPQEAWLSTYINFDVNSPLDIGTDRAIGKLKSLAEIGNPTAQYQYGLLLSQNLDPMKPSREGLQWMVRAAQAGLASAQYRVGFSLLHGRDCEQDKTKAIEWLRRSTAQNHAEAQLELSKQFLKEGPDYDPSKAVSLLETSAAAGSFSARKYLAALFAASSAASARNPTRALDLVNTLIDQDPSDISLLEIKAAALANTGRFDDAVSVQTDALTAARKRKWNLGDAELRLSSYRSANPWYGDVLGLQNVTFSMANISR
jgi:uncharacterized protein